MILQALNLIHFQPRSYIEIKVPHFKNYYSYAKYVVSFALCVYSSSKTNQRLGKIPFNPEVLFIKQQNS
jgi:hypothetical protein